MQLVNQGMLQNGFRASREARERYQIPASLVTRQGNITLATFRDARVLAQRINAQRDVMHAPERTARAGHLNAMGLIDEILRYVCAQYRQQRNPPALAKALDWLVAHLGHEQATATLLRFTGDFPPLDVVEGETTTAYLAATADGDTHRQLMLEELLMVWLANMNTAYAPYRDLFDDTPLAVETAYRELITDLDDFFATQPTFGPEEQSLIALLRSPALASPHSLAGQLEYIMTRWGYLLGDYYFRLLGSLDLIKEEEKAIFSGPGPSLVYDYTAQYDEPERFSQDRDWMPCLVLMAKNTYVWLDQLSKKYQRAITRLDQIPDEELDLLAHRGFTGLWLIGLWERSTASQRIKQYCGNGDAVASAYSLKAYEVAEDLGGSAALEDLKARAWRRRIRLASDMVPNHMGIDSHWVIEHPDWFVALDYSPFPAYSFNGGNLSNDERVGIYIDDQYYSHSDAAVVFKRVDHWTGATKYIYHGNDGTNMPWNDTAQLNYLLPEVREAVIQTILHVARQFPIIRFDAAMTLAKKHYQRLWFPEPGSGGAIPSRAEHGLPRARFDEVFPVEFWREVVDRVAQEVPDTLLLAEAFWLMEGYFVRTLGMHRVYNSAFMNMLRDEDNAKYRSVMKNTMEFDPEIMKRFVNFMNNPDERTAVDQFGTGDKYFGACTMMVTLPGLPMFGHGQIEGFAEKYGMEFRRAYWDEQVDSSLVERHEREIFPLLHRRYIFAGDANFQLYDFYTPEGYVNEDVYAYSNRAGHESGLIIYHNKYAETCGWIRTSAAALDKAAPAGERQLRQRTISEGLQLRGAEGDYTIFRDYATGLEYIRASREVCDKGIFVSLRAYQYHTFLDFREVQDNAWGHYGQVCAQLNGRGVPSVDNAVRELYLRPVHEPFRALVNAEQFQRLLAARVTTADGPPAPVLLDDVEARVATLLRAVADFTGCTGDTAAIARTLRGMLAALLQLPVAAHQLPTLATQSVALDDDPASWGVLFGWLCTHALGQVVAAEDGAQQSRAWLDEWMLGRIVTDTLQELGVPGAAADHAGIVLRALVAEQDWMTAGSELTASELLTRWLQDDEIRRVLGVNRYEDVLWFNREGFAEWLHWLQLLAITHALTTNTLESDTRLRDNLARLDTLRQAEATSDYRVDRLLAAAQTSTLALAGE